MDCLVIAAGQGSRLRSLGESKPLVPVAGRPLIEHVITRAAAGGATRFVVATGHRAALLEAFLDDLAGRSGWPIDTVRVADPDLANGHSVLAADALLGATPHLLMMADHVVDPAIVARMAATPLDGDDVLLAVDRRLDNALVDLDDVTRVATERDRIVAIGKQLATFDAFDTGVFVATPALRAALHGVVAQGGDGSLSAGVARLATQGRVRAIDVGESWWCDVDDPAAHRACEAALAA